MRDLLLNVPSAHASNPELRRATLVGCCRFAAFSSFWTALSLHLSLPTLSKGATFAGGFGLIGIAGAIVAQLAGRASDRWGERRVVFAGLCGALLGFVILCLTPTSLAGLAIGALVMDAGCFGAHAATQGYILRTGGDERSRRYSAYMTVYWTAGALGSFTAPALFQAGGWLTLNLVDAVLIAIGTILHACSHRRSSSPPNRRAATVELVHHSDRNRRLIRPRRGLLRMLTVFTTSSGNDEK